LKQKNYIGLFALTAIFICSNVLFTQTSIANNENNTQKGIQIISPRFEHLTVSDGLSQGYVRVIYQDSKGFMWFGTRDGLNRYDGNNFRVFRNDPFDSTSISGNNITAINEDRFGRLWIGTLHNGLNCFDPATEAWRRFLHDPNNTNSLSSNQIIAICDDVTQNKNHSTTLWIGTGYGLNKHVLREGGVLVLREGEPGRIRAGINSTPDYTITNYFYNSLDSSSLSNDVIFDLLIDRSNNLWIATKNGLNKLDLRVHNPNQPERFQRFMLEGENSTLFESSDGTLWVSSRRSLWKLDLEESRAGRFQNMLCFEELTHIELRDIFLKGMCQDQKGLLWLAMSYGLIIFDPKTNSFQLFRKQKDDPSSFIDSRLTCIFQDRSYLVWMGTVGFGLNKYDPYKEVFQTFTYKKIPKEPIRNIHLANYIQELMVYGAVSMKNQTFLFDFDLRSGAYQLRRTFDHSERVMMDHKKVGWVLSEKLLIRCDMESQTFRDIIPDSMKNSLHLMTQLEDGNKNIWAIGTYRKKIILCCWDRDTQSIFSNLIENPESIGYPNNRITDSFRDHSGIFWLTSLNGLYRIDLSTASLRIFHNDPRNRRSLNQNNLKSMLPDPVFPDSFLWIGTNGGGLNRFEKGAEIFTHHTEKDGLPNNVVYGILTDGKGNLWMSTNRGIANAILDPKTREIVSFKNYDEGDGLQGDEFNTWQYFQNERGDMFFAGIQGITVFHPDSVKRNPQAPPVVITGFQIHQQLVMPGSPGSPLEKVIAATEKITLPHSDNAITFESTVLDYANPGKNLLSYKIEGLNLDWSPPSNNRRAVFTNLDPGDYVFRVRGSNSHGIWNETGASLEITILPPWWRTWWAYVLYILLSLGTISGLLRYEISRREAKHKYELEHVETEKLQD
jgi:ligand-binding sensor domain-containing protein